MIHRDDELRALESELKHLRPRRLPLGFQERLLERSPEASPATPARPDRTLAFWRSWRRLVFPLSAGALAAVLLLVWPVRPPVPPLKTGDVQNVEPAFPTPASTDQVEFDSQLLASFDAVAELPGGIPVRFECRQYEDRVIFHHANADLTVERSVPRLEIVPVRFETY